MLYFMSKPKNKNMDQSRNYGVYRSYKQLPVKNNPKRPKTSVRTVVLALTALSVLAVGGYLAITSRANARAHPAEVIALQQKNAQKKVLTKNVIYILATSPGVDFSVTAIDLATGAKQNFGSQKPMNAASTAKLITAALFLHQVENGKYKLHQKLDGNDADYLLDNLINKSDDQAWQILNTWLGHQALKNYATSLGLSSYDPVLNSITADDMAVFLQKLATNQLLSDTNTKRLESYMQNTNYEDFITPALPAGYKIYHKVGLTDDSVNDVAIISDGHRKFVLAIYSNGHGIYNWGQRALTMQKITTSALPVYL
jgi:beta-lactamase class A